MIGTTSTISLDSPDAAPGPFSLYSKTFGDAGGWIDAMLRDWDGDSVEDSIDNCPTVANADQANCNKDAEVAWNINHPTDQVQVLGDACDPVPCPSSSTNRVTAARAVTGDCRPPASVFQTKVCIGREIRDQIDTAPLGAHARDDALLGGVGEQPVPVVTTDARFCEQNRAAGFDCASPGNTQFPLLDAPEANILVPSRPWHRISLGTRPQCHRRCPPPRPRGESLVLDYGTAVRPSFQWAYLADDAFWHSTAIPAIPLPGDYPTCSDNAAFGAGTCLDGRLWLFGRTPVGSDVDHTRVNNVPIGFHGVELSSHYFPARPDRTLAGSYGMPRIKFPFFLWRTLPDPPPDGSALTRFDPGEAFPIVAVGTRLLALRDTFEAQDVTLAVDPGLRGLLRDPNLLWLHAVEPSPFSGRPFAPLAMALTSDGTTLGGVAFEFNGQLTLGGLTDAPAPTPRTAFAAVYSRVAGGAFVAGGVDGAGRVLDDIWFLDVDTGEWRQIGVPPGVLGRVASAAFAWRDGRLWILDEVGKTRRLLRVDPASGAFEIIASADSASPRYDFRGLLVDMDGAVLLFASSQRDQTHRLARIAPAVAPVPGASATSIPLSVGLTHRRPRALAIAPIVDLRGVRFTFQPRDAAKEHDDDSGDKSDKGDKHGGDASDGREEDDDPEAPDVRDAAGLRVPSLSFEPEDLDDLRALLR